jgi:hypothetical protein
MSTRKTAPRQALAEFAGKIEEGVSTPKANSRKALAEFAGKIEKGKGWWYRLPQSPGVGNQGAPDDSVHPDGIMPQLGVLFSLDESAMLAILYQMGCYAKKGDAFIAHNNGWENLVSEFKIPPTSLEIQSLKIGKYPRSYYIKIGNVSMAPVKIYAKFNANPKEYHTPSVSTQQSREIVAEIMVQSKKESDAAAVIAAKTLAEKEKARVAANALAEKEKAVIDLSKKAAAAITDPVKYMFRDNFSEGTLADYSSPVLQHFGVPIDNQSTLTRLHLEVTRALIACQKASASASATTPPTGASATSASASATTPPTGEKVINRGTLSEAIIYKDSNSHHTYTSIMIPKGRSSATILKLRRTITAMTEYCVEPKGKEDEEAQNCIRQVIGEFEKRYPDEFLKVCVSKNYSTSKAGKMPAQFWNAMADDANLLMSQQRIVNRYLTHHFGAGVRVSETELRQKMDDPDIKKEQAAVAEGSKRNLKRNLKRGPEALLKRELKRQPGATLEPPCYDPSKVARRETSIEKEIRARIENDRKKKEIRTRI